MNLKQKLAEVLDKVDNENFITVSGVVTKITGMKIEAVNLIAPVGTLCKIHLSETHSVNAEIIGFADNKTYLMPMEHADGIIQGTLVTPIPKLRHARVGSAMLGRILDASGIPIDGKGDYEANETYPLIARTINPLARRKITSSLDVGIRAINSLITVSEGQRLGIFAGSGVGKSVLLGMMTRFTSADVVVVGLIGERGREVKEFIEENLGEGGLAKSVVIAAAADTSPLMRVNGALYAATIAEYFRDKGLNVLLIVDSLTRFAQAQREISLSVGELPATKGFTPSVFAKISQLVERSGNGTGKSGSITAFYTVLIEGDDLHDPIGDHARSVLDGHIVLSRQLAESGHYPAIDVEKSISRVMTAIASEKHQSAARRFKQLYSTFSSNSDLINVGMYQQGANKDIDEAIKFKEKMDNFLKQGINESCNMEESINQLYAIFQS